MSRTLLNFRIEKILDHTPSVRELILKLDGPGEFNFKAGQFVMLHVPQAEKPALRAYSIASTDQRKDGFTLLFKFVENGVASTFVWGLKGEETLQFTGPFGRVFFKEPPTQQIVFLNTGTGISQHICYLMSKKDLFPDVKYRMLFGVRNEKEIYYQPQLDDLSKQMKDFKYEFVLSRASENWPGKKGYVQHFLEQFDYKNIDTTFYLCGNGGMIKEVKQILIEQNGFDKTKIHSEAFD
jgi:CDP-4-dehydro-6-deoxyglucose reductase, E3